MRTFALLYFILICPVWLSSLGCLMFSEEEMDVDCIWWFQEVERWLKGEEGEEIL